VIPLKKEKGTSSQEQTAGKPIIELALSPFSDKKVYI
jgi:hypothetical protein